MFGNKWWSGVLSIIFLFFLDDDFQSEEDEQLAKALQESYPFAEDEQLAKALQESCPSEEDELLAKALHESLLESPPQYG